MSSSSFSRYQVDLSVEVEHLTRRIQELSGMRNVPGMEILQDLQNDAHSLDETLPVYPWVTSRNHARRGGIIIPIPDDSTRNDFLLQLQEDNKRIFQEWAWNMSIVKVLRVVSRNIDKSIRETTDNIVILGTALHNRSRNREYLDIITEALNDEAIGSAERSRFLRSLVRHMSFLVARGLSTE